MDAMRDMVIQASTTFYTTKDKEQRKKAEEWLENFKQSIQAWYITDQLLHTEKNEQVLFFAAQTIRNKIQFNFHELPLDSHESLKNSLLEHMEKLSTFNLSTVQTQIYIALADLIMLMTTWQNPMLDLLTRFNKEQDKYPSFVEFLTVLPEEIHNKRLKLGFNRRDQIRKQLYDESVNVISFLESNFNKYLNDQNKLRSIYKCFSSWIDQQLFNTSQILNSSLYQQIFHFLRDQNITLEFHETLSHCIANTLIMYHGISVIHEQDRGLIVSLKENIIGLAETYKLAEQTRNTEKCLDFCLIFTELCTSLAYYLVNEPDTVYGDFNCINLLLLIASNTEYEVFQKSFLFWFNISEDIYQNPKCESICEKMSPYVEHLIESICKHCRLPQDHVGMPPSKSSEFGEFRLKASDLVADCVFIVESNQCFEKLFSVLQVNTSSWSELEAALFIMCSFAKCISPDSKASVAQVVQALTSLNSQVHIAVRYTGIRLLGELCDWLEKNSQYIDGCLNFIFAGFTDPLLCQIAANTILNICTQCQSHMLSHLDTLINIVISADTINIPSDAFIGLMKGTITVLSNVPNEKIGEPLMKLCRMQIEGLQKVLNGESVKEGLKSTPNYWLERLVSIFRTIKINEPANPSNPCKEVLEYIWPTISLCCTKYQKENKVTEQCCKTLRFAIRCTDKQSRNILEPLVNMIVSFYQNNHHSCYLYLGSIIVDIFGAEPDFKSGLIQMMQAFTAEAFGYIMQNCKSVDNINELQKYPDTMDDFFRLALRFIKKCPKEFIETPVFIPIINLAVNTLSLDNRDAHSSITRFLSDFVSVSNNAAVRGLENVSNQVMLSRLVNEMSEKIVDNSINAVVNMATRDTKDGLADLLSELISANEKTIDACLLNTLRSLVKISPTGAEIVSDRQLLDVHERIMRSESSTDIEQALTQLEQLFQ